MNTEPMYMTISVIEYNQIKHKANMADQYERHWKLKEEELRKENDVLKTINENLQMQVMDLRIRLRGKDDT